MLHMLDKYVISYLKKKILKLTFISKPSSQQKCRVKDEAVKLFPMSITDAYFIFSIWSNEQRRLEEFPSMSSPSGRSTTIRGSFEAQSDPQQLHSTTNERPARGPRSAVIPNHVFPNGRRNLGSRLPLIIAYLPSPSHLNVWGKKEKK